MEVISVPPARLDEAADVLAAAFAGDPLVRYFLDDGRENLAEKTRAMFRFICQYRQMIGWPVLGVADAGRLTGVACVTPPADGDATTEDPPEVQAAEEALMAMLGPQAGQRLEAYGQLKEQYALPEPHHYLVAIGVQPSHQHCGHGRALLQAVSDLADTHPTSTGVSLDTELPANVCLYEHVGYRHLAKDHLGDVPIWFLHRPRTNRER